MDLQGIKLALGMLFANRKFIKVDFYQQKLA
jgi:hypothetical protein